MFDKPFSVNQLRVNARLAGLGHKSVVKLLVPLVSRGHAPHIVSLHLRVVSVHAWQSTGFVSHVLIQTKDYYYFKLKLIVKSSITETVVSCSMRPY